MGFYFGNFEACADQNIFDDDIFIMLEQNWFAALNRAGFAAMILVSSVIVIEEFDHEGEIAQIMGTLFNDIQLANIAGICEGGNLRFGYNDCSIAASVGQDITIYRVVRFNNGICRIFGQIVDSDALAMG